MPRTLIRTTRLHLVEVVVQQQMRSRPGDRLLDDRLQDGRGQRGRRHVSAGARQCRTSREEACNKDRTGEGHQRQLIGELACLRGGPHHRILPMGCEFLDDRYVGFFDLRQIRPASALAHVILRTPAD